MPPDERGDPLVAYDERRSRFTAARRELEARSGRLSVARLGAFLSALAVAIAGIAGGLPIEIAVPVSLLIAVIFAVLVRVHGRIQRASDRHALLARVNDLASARARRDWNAIPKPPGIPIPEQHPYAADLALFGHASLWQLLPDVSPAAGRQVLRDWLLAPAAVPDVHERQDAVTELAPRIDLRDDLTALALELRGAPPTVLAAATRLPESVAWLDGERWLVPAARVLTALSAGIWLSILGGVLAPGWAWLPLAVLGAVWGARARRLRRTFASAESLAAALPWYADLVDRLAGEQVTSPLLRRLTSALYRSEHHAGRSLRALRRILRCAEVRYSPMLHIPLQALGLWDIHVVHALARWCRAHGADIAAWLQSLGTVEALSSLAGLRHANPTWCVPLVRDASGGEEVRIEARGLGHPLIAPQVMVANDLTIGPPGTFVLVTGSNMSGKSTLLRAAGLNAVLAQAGAPVCAASFQMPPLRVQTSIRIQDSLADGVSLFMAELERLRQVVDAAEQPPPSAPALYLLDEMLQGTNSAERHLAARAVLARLVRSRSIGLVTTHDVALASAPELAAVAVPVFFDESVRRSPDVPLSFDYRLRPGIVPAGNALRLLSLVGLADDPNAR